jgi:predicted nuclease with TOPRIM domain
MNTIKRASYLKGLAEGLALDDSTSERKLINALIETIGELAEELDELRSDIADLDEDLTNLNEDFDLLSDQVDDLYELIDYDDREPEGAETCPGCGRHEEDAETLELDCPACGELITIDEEMFLNRRFECPYCEEVLEIDMSDAEEDDDNSESYESK